MVFVLQVERHIDDI